MQEFVCRCKYIGNYFIKKYRLHVTFINDEQFISDYKQILYNSGCTTETELTAVLNELHQEKERRLNTHDEAFERAKLIREQYKPMRQDIYELKESFLDPEFINLASKAKDVDTTRDTLLKFVKAERAPRVYSFKVFTPEFVSAFLEELAHFENSSFPKGRPNSMNNYGILLKEIGFESKFIDPLRKDYLLPIAKVFYPEWGGSGLDSQRSFIVFYKEDQDVDLSYHYDNSEVTLNVSLGKQFSGGEVFFGSMRQDQVQLQQSETFPCVHKTTYGFLHRGQHLHGAMPIEEGERYNLIIWMRASSVRNQLCPMCDAKPDLIPVPFDGDGFTEPQVNVCVTL